MYTLLALSFFVWLLTFFSARRFYIIFNEHNYPIGKLIPTFGLIIGIAIFADHYHRDNLILGDQDTLFLLLIYALLSGIFVNTISFLYGKKQYYDKKEENTVGFVSLTLFNIVGLISSILGIVELYLKLIF